MTSFASRVSESLKLMLAVIVSPRRAFSRIESARPFLLVWIIGGAFGILQAWSIFHKLGVDAIVRSGLSQMPELKYTAAQIAVMKRNTIAFFPIQVVGTTLLWILTIIVIATILFEIDKRVFGNQRSYKTVLSIVSYAQMPSILFSVVVFILLWIYPDPSHLQVNTLIGTNASLLIPPASVQEFFRVILSALDIWTMWTVGLLAIGLSSERTAITKSLSCICGLWLTFITAKAGISAMFLHNAVMAAHKTGIGR